MFQTPKSTKIYEKQNNISNPTLPRTEVSGLYSFHTERRIAIGGTCRNNLYVPPDNPLSSRSQGRPRQTVVSYQAVPVYIRFSFVLRVVCVISLPVHGIRLPLMLRLVCLITAISPAVHCNDYRLRSDFELHMCVIIGIIPTPHNPSPLSKEFALASCCCLLSEQPFPRFISLIISHYADRNAYSF